MLKLAFSILSVFVISTTLGGYSKGSLIYEVNPKERGSDLDIDIEIDYRTFDNFDTLDFVERNIGTTQDNIDQYVLDVYNNKNHNKFGHITYDSSALLTKEEQTYQSGIFPNDQHFTTLDALKSYSFYFDEFYIDVPVEILYIRNIPANVGAVFTSEFQYEHSELTETTTTFAMDLLFEFTLTSGYEIGVELPIDFIVLNLSQYFEGSIGFSASLFYEIQTMTSSYTHFSSVISETYSIHNSNNFPIYAQLNFRQKFRLYFTVNLKYDYIVTETTTGIFQDKSWTYDHVGTNVDSVTFFLLPEDDPYFDVSKYYDDADGTKTILEKSHPSILYF